MLAPLLVAASLIVVAPAPPAAAVAPTIAVSVSGSAQVIAGENATYSISATNTGATDGFNLALVLDVPEGIAFVSSTLGAPVIYDSTNPPPTPLPVGVVRWVWQDVSDLPASGVFGGSVTVHPTQPPMGTGETTATNVFPVGSTYSVAATAALGGDPRYLPVFNGSTGVGGPVAEAETATATSTTSTDMIALELTKDEPSPEAELLRGVHDQTTVYTLTVRNTSEGITEDALLVDHLPAGLEFLGCGGVDNSTVDRDLGDPAVNEYLGASALTSTPVIVASCPTPLSVDTLVADAALASQYGLTAGSVYTQVVWDLGDLAAGSTTLVRYAAAIPLYENTVTWDAAAPTPESLGQAANLDNNNGPSTRHGDPATPVDGDTWTNTANIEGSYAGVIRTGADRLTTDRASTSVFAMDLSILKGIDPADATFDVGSVADFTLTLRASEYMDSSAIVVTDVLENGLCPLMPSGTPLIEIGVTVPAECLVAGTVTGAEMVSVTAFADGTFEIVFRPTSATYPDPDDFVLGANETHAITYGAFNRDAYVLAPTEYGPTTSGDDFGNTVSFEAVTDAITPLVPWFPDTWQVWDDSGSTIESDLTTIAKLVMPRDEVEVGAAGNPCTLGTFANGIEAGFRLGDTVCFELTVDFPDSIDVRNPVITDFLPDGLTYAGYEVQPGSVGPIIPTSLDATVGRLEWQLGTLGDGNDLYVPRGSVFVAHLWATVDAPSSGPILDKPENLMKYRQQNVEGELYFLRDEAEIEIDPELELIKGVLDVTDNSSAVSSTRPAVSQDDPDGTAFASNRDGILVREGEVVTYRVDLRTMPYPAAGATVWDVLPPGFEAADVSAISDGGTAYDPADAGYPAGMDPALATRSVVVWTGVAVPYVPAELESRKTLTYDVTIPVGTSVATTHDNDASIIQYSAGINTSLDPNAQPYYPTDSFDVSLTALWNTPGTNTRDDSNVYLPVATIAKTVTSPLDTNNTALQAVKGEIIHFTYGVTIPAHSSVRNGVLSDALVTAGNWTIHPDLITVDHPGGSTAPGTNGAFLVGTDTFTVDTSNGRLTFPALYTNATDSAQVFAVNLYVHVRGAATWTHSTTSRRNDTATFASSTQSNITATSGIYVITPDPTIGKLVNDDSVVAGQTVTYTLTARNNAANDRPTLYDTVVVDCVPTGLTGVALGVASQGSAAVVPDPSCTGTRIVWDVGALLSGSANYETLSYTATVSPAAAGNAIYANTARLTGYSLDDEPADRAVQTTTATETVTVLGAPLVKSVDAPTATVGEERAYTVTISLPADVNFYDAAIIDDVPAGLAVSGISITCTYGGGGDCLGDLPGGGATLTPSGTRIGWWLGDILSDPDTRAVVLTYTGTVLDVPANVDAATIPNTARFRWSTTNAIVGPPADASYTPDAVASDDATVTVVEPDVEIAKTVNGLDADTVAPGEAFVYQVTATNTGTSTAYDVTVEDVVPTGVVVNAPAISHGGTIAGADPVTGGGTISWSLGSLAVGAARSLTYAAALAPSSTLDASSLTNVAEVTGYGSHPTGTPGFDDDELRSYSGDTADAVVNPVFPDPTVVKTPAAGPAYIGSSHSFAIVVTNAGGSTATSVVVTDTLPAGWVYDVGSTTIDSAAAADPTIVGQDLTWSALTDLNPAGAVTIGYTAHPDAGATWTAANTGSGYDHTNDVTVTVEDLTGSPGNLDGTYSDATDADVQIHAADLSIDKAHIGSPTAGAPFSWTITVINDASSDPAVGPIVVVDTLPADATYTGFSGAGWTADLSVLGQVTFTHAGPVATGGALPIITVNVTLGEDLPTDTDFTNSVVVSALTFDPDTDNNSDDDPASTVLVADVALTKASLGGPFVAGEAIVWEIDVTNNGPSVASGPFTVTDTLPATVDWTSVSASGTGWSCDPVTITRVLECTWSTLPLPVGASTPTLEVEATILASATGTVDNTATVSHPTPDTDPLNNTDDDSDPIGTSADLSLGKTTVSVDIPADGIGRFRIEVANAGPSDARNVVVDDTLPGGLSYLGNLTAAPGDAWSCAANIIDPSQIGCTLDSNGGTLPLGETSWFEFDVQADSTVTAAVLNVATVSSDTPDTEPRNNTDDSTTAPVLTVHKEAAPRSVERGSSVVYTINVESLSYGATDDVTLVDELPAELKVTSIVVSSSSDPTVPDWLGCDHTGADARGYGGTLTCVLGGTLERGRTAPAIVVTATVLPSMAPGTLTNQAVVRWTDPADVSAGSFLANDDALVSVTLTGAELSATGLSGLRNMVTAALVLLALGGLLIVVARRRDEEGFEDA